MDNFINRFSNKQVTNDILAELVKKAKNIENIDIMTLLTKELKTFDSTSEVRRLIKQGAVKINDNPVNAIDYKCPKNKEFLLKVGKKIAYKVTIK